VLSFRAKICLIPRDSDIECELIMRKTNYEHALNLMTIKANNYKDMCLLKKMKKWNEKMKWKMKEKWWWKMNDWGWKEKKNEETKVLGDSCITCIHIL